jgi:hypothetical protein
MYYRSRREENPATLDSLCWRGASVTSSGQTLVRSPLGQVSGPLVHSTQWLHSIQWRNRLAYLVMSLVVGWHTLAIVIGPAPDGSAMVQSLNLLVAPYLSLFRLGSHWGFFAPEVGKQAVFSYVVEDAAGERHTFVPSEESSGSISRYVMWREFKYFFDSVMDAPEVHAEATAAVLCRMHASLNPVAVSLLQVQELDFWPEHYLEGHRPLDPNFVTVSTLAQVKCRDGSLLPRRSPIRPVRRH